MNKLIPVAGLALVAVLAGPTTALAGDTFCPPALVGPTTVDNLVVIGPCTVTGLVQVRGNVKVLFNGALDVAAGSIVVSGNIQVEPGGQLDISASGSSASNIQCKGAVPPDGCRVMSTTVRGNLESIESSGSVIFSDNIVDGNVKAEKNTGGGTITGNMILKGNLECKENNPLITAAGNMVGGNNSCP